MTKPVIHSEMQKKTNPGTGPNTFAEKREGIHDFRERVARRGIKVRDEDDFYLDDIGESELHF